MHAALLKFIIVPVFVFFAAAANAQSIGIRHQLLQPTPHVAEDSALSRTFNFVTADHYTKQLGFVCRQEWKLEKAIRVPLRIRVGSLEQCNLLEGKSR